MRKVRTVAIVLLLLLGILFFWKSVDPQETVFGAPRDAIPAVSDPEFRAAEDVTISDQYLVIGVALNGEAKAYPILILDWHEIVNDEVGGVPIAVTYCPLCGSGVVFDRQVDGRALTFGVSGLLYKNDLVLYDHQTGSQWVQLTGTAIRGPLEGTRLDVVSARTIQWGSWRALWPNSTFMEFPSFSRDYGFYPYGDYRESEAVNFPREFVDTTLPAKEIVLGVKLGDAVMAYPTSVLREERVVNDAVGGTPVVVTYYNDALAVYERGNETFAFSDGFHMVDTSGNRWNMVTGQGEPGGPHEDDHLEEVAAVTSYWFAWLDFHPDTAVYGVARDSPVGLGLLQSYWAVLLAAAVAAGAVAVHRSRWRRRQALAEGRWIKLARSRLYGAGAIVLGLLVASFGVGDLRWTNAAASVGLGAALVGLGAYLIGESWTMRPYATRFTGLSREEADERIQGTLMPAGEARPADDVTMWPRTGGAAFDLGGERVVVVDDWAFAETGGRGALALSAPLWGDEEE